MGQRDVSCDVPSVSLWTVSAVYGNPFRSSDPMYEVGVVQAVRLPGKMLLFRSDTVNTRMNSYSPDDDPERVRNQLAATAVTALREVDVVKTFTAKKAAEPLPYSSWLALLQAIVLTSIRPRFRWL